MKLFSLKSQVHKFDTLKEFNEFFKLGPEDLVFTSENLYKNYFEPMNINALFLFQKTYGHGEPSNDVVDKVVEDLKGKEYKRVFAIGGGSILDIGKMLVLKGSYKTMDVLERKVPVIKDKELIMVPTTCGTGSEVTNLSILLITEKQTKMGLAADEICADYACLVPELLKGLPYSFFVYSSIDALIHAMESFVSPKASCFTELYSMKAIEMIIKGYMKIIEKGKDYRNEIIEDFLTGSTYAGIAFGNAGVGAVHALSYPLGGKHHVPHGEANYQFFTEVFKLYHSKNPEGKIALVNAMISDILGLNAQESVYSGLEKVLDQLLPRKPLREYGMTEEEIAGFTDTVIATQQRLLGNNYVPLSREEIYNIYNKLY